MVNQQVFEQRAPAPRSGGQSGSNPSRGRRGGARPGGDDRSAGAGRGTGSSQARRGTPQLSPDDVRRLYEERRCFICREKGYQSRECPKNGFNKEDRIRELQAKWASPARASAPALQSN
jgi:hypothetical protein